MDDRQFEKLLGFYNQGDLGSVLQYGNQLLAEHPTAVILHNIMGAAQSASGDTNLAVFHFGKALQLTPADAAAHSNLGLALQRQGDVEGAIISFREAIQLDLSNAEYMLLLGEAQRLAGHDDEAMESFAKVAAKHPDYPAAHASMGIILKNIGHLAKAVECFKRVINLTPNDPGALMNLGSALSSLGLTDDAIEAYRHAIRLVPADATPHFNLGVIQKNAGMHEAAASSYQEAIRLAPENDEYHNVLGLTLRDLGRRQDAIKCFAAAIVAKPDSAEAHNNLGLVLSEVGLLEEALIEVEHAISLRPAYPSANTNLVNILNLQVPRWHVNMMNDTPRNEAFFRAIEAAVSKDDLVLEIGTGSGLLAMKAADCGAAQVTTCEMSTTISRAAQEIIDLNGFSKTVKVLNKKSTDLRIPDDLPRQANVVLAEVLSSEFVGEGVISSLRDARSRLLANDGKMVPAGGSIMIALLADVPGLSEQAFVGEVGGYDLSHFNSITSHKIDISLASRDVRFLTKPIAPFEFDFYDASAFANKNIKLEVTVTEDGPCIGILQWNRVDLGNGIIYENDPQLITSHWLTPLYRFDAVQYLKADQKIKIEGSLAEDRVWFRLEE